MTKRSSASATLMLLIASVIWGSAFLAQGKGAEHVGTFTFTGIRFLIGGIFLIPVIRISDLYKKKRGEHSPLQKQDLKHLFISGILCGLVLATASLLQQAGMGGLAGIEPTSPGKAGFLTALYILFVPIIGSFFKKKTPLAFWGCVAVAIVGFYFLSMTPDSLSVQSGDALVLACSVAFSVHIILIDRYTSVCDPIKLSCIQFLTVGIIGTALMFIFESPSWESIRGAGFAIFYTGLFSCGIAYTFQSVAQKHIHPTLATLIMSLESVFALVTGMIFDFANNVPTLREGIGSILIFATVLVAQLLPAPNDKNSENKETQNETR